MIEELIRELNQLAIEEKYNYRFVNMLDSIISVWSRGDVEQLNTLTKNAARLLAEYREVSYKNMGVQ